MVVIFHSRFLQKNLLKQRSGMKFYVRGRQNVNKERRRAWITKRSGKSDKPFLSSV